MRKIFLSHSSKDKDYVSEIAEYFGRDRCVYDSMCFETGMKCIDEIFRGFDNSCIFVVFLSDSALESDWVKFELSVAEERLLYNKQKLSQIFPIIIDPSINHKDPRIPRFLKEGFGAYNLRVITSSIVACRKIKTQQIKYLIDNNLLLPNERECFYGRDDEISSFKKVFDTGHEISCIVASGLTGIGRKSYLMQCLKKSELIEEYYMPPIISLDRMSSIEDMLVKFSEIGFGNYSLEAAASLSDLNAKTQALIEILRSVQDYQERIIIYDNGCLIDHKGNIVDWFGDVLKDIRPEVTVIIAASHRVNSFTLQKNPSVFAKQLSTLSYSEWLGLMRVYGKSRNIDIPSDDRVYFRDIITGYPPQVRYCVDLMKETSIEEVKNNPHRIIDYFSPKVTTILEAIIPQDINVDAYGLLAFMSSYGIVPTDLLVTVLEIKGIYKTAFALFRASTICRYLGVSNEYIEVNPLISDYIQRSHFKVPDDIDEMLKKRLDAFNDSIQNEDKTKGEDFENIKYYLKTNILNGKEIPSRFMYSTLYISSIYDLYNNQKYPQVISIVKGLKNAGAFDRYDYSAQAQIQRYFCRSLARVGDDLFYKEVEFFKYYAHDSQNIEYNFLRGFKFRQEAEYSKALGYYKKVLSEQPKHRSAMSEIVIVYRNLEDYENAYEYAKANYLREPENPYQIQPFFEILIRKSSALTKEEDNYINEILDTMKRIQLTKPTNTYYEILGQYAAFVERNKDRAISLLRNGNDIFPESSFVVRSLFDCAEQFRDTDVMKEALVQLKELSSNSKSIMLAYQIRTAIYNAYEQKPRDFILNQIDSIIGLNNEAKTRLKGRIDSIMCHSNNRVF